MNTKTNIPKWFNEGPHDIEYRTYKLKGAISNIDGMLNSGQLIPALFEIDDTLDYSYRYDSVRITHNPNPILPTDQIVSGFEIPGLELFFTEEDELETDNVLDSILDEAIDSFEELHAMCRERWRLIEDGTTCVYVPAKKYFLNDGFVFIRTADNMLHVYHLRQRTRARETPQDESHHGGPGDEQDKDADDRGCLAALATIAACVLHV